MVHISCSLDNSCCCSKEKGRCNILKKGKNNFHFFPISAISVLRPQLWGNYGFKKKKAYLQIGYEAFFGVAMLLARRVGVQFFIAAILHHFAIDFQFGKIICSNCARTKPHQVRRHGRPKEEKKKENETTNAFILQLRKWKKTSADHVLDTWFGPTRIPTPTTEANVKRFDRTNTCFFVCWL